MNADQDRAWEAYKAWVAANPSQGSVTWAGCFRAGYDAAARAQVEEATAATNRAKALVLFDAEEAFRCAERVFRGGSRYDYDAAAAVIKEYADQQVEAALAGQAAVLARAREALEEIRGLAASIFNGVNDAHDAAFEIVGVAQDAIAADGAVPDGQGG